MASDALGLERKQAQDLIKSKDVSKVGVAREYVNRLAQVDAKQGEASNAVKTLVGSLSSAVNLPTRKLATKEILAS